MPEENQAFVLQSIKRVSFEKLEVPKLRDEYDVRVHIEQTGICGSDVHFWQRGRIGDLIIDSPWVLGHESSGTVVEVGSKVLNVKPGQRVAIEPAVPCRRCDSCRSGDYYLCDDIGFDDRGRLRDGTLQKYYVTACDYTYPIPDSMTAEDGAFIEPISVAVQICKVGNLKGGQTVLVFGCGPIGVLCQAVAKAYGASKVVGVDISESRALFAKEFAADDVYVSKELPDAPENPMEASRAIAQKILRDYGLGGGADLVLECTGAEPCVQAGVFATKKGGTYVQAGLNKESVLFPITTACAGALTIKGSYRYSKGCFTDAIHLVAAGKINPKRLISHRFTFRQAAEAFELAKLGQENTLKVMIEGVKN